MKPHCLVWSQLCLQGIPPRKCRFTLMVWFSVGGCLLSLLSSCPGCRSTSMWSYLNSFQKKFRKPVYPEQKRKKATPISDFTEWVLAFSTFGQALASRDPALALKLLVFVGSVARLARDLPGSAWAVYERAARGKAVANPSFPWEKLDQELWALASVHNSTAPSGPSVVQKGKWPKSELACFKWNDGTCTFRSCKFGHVCSSCFSPKHKAGACPSGAPKTKKSTV